MRSAAKSGTDSPFTTRRRTGVGSIRPRSKSASSPGNASVPEESLICRPCAGKPEPGIVASAAPAPKSTGSLAAKPRDASSATKGTPLSGQRPSPWRNGFQGQGWSNPCHCSFLMTNLFSCFRSHVVLGTKKSALITGEVSTLQTPPHILIQFYNPGCWKLILLLVKCL